MHENNLQSKDKLLNKDPTGKKSQQNRRNNSKPGNNLKNNGEFFYLVAFF